MLIETYSKFAECEQKRIFDGDICKLHDLSSSGEDTLWDHQLKCIAICRSHLGFCGNKEHVDLKAENARIGHFEVGQPCDVCARGLRQFAH